MTRCRSLKICMVSPYISQHSGGGEKHLLDVATAFSAAGHRVEIGLPESTTHDALTGIQQRLDDAFAVDTKQFNWVASPLLSPASSWKKLLWTRKYDVIYFVSDGSLFFSLAQRNILHIQIPFTHKLNLMNWFKLRCWHHIQTNSAFTKNNIERNWNCRVHSVVHPLLDPAVNRVPMDGSKKNQILSVGRFFRQLHSKRQDVLIEAFRQLLAKTREADGWRLVLVGSVEDHAYVAELKRSSIGLPIEFQTELSRGKVIDLYKESKIFWHAAGFEQDEVAHPERVEHFGIATVEAMAAGTVPLAVGKGGQAEILSGELQDLQWQTVEELVTKTSILIRSEDYYRKFQSLAIKRAEDFSLAIFRKNVLSMLD